MRFFLQAIVLLFIAVISSLPSAAQQADSAWFIKWERYIEEADGTRDSSFTNEATMWLEGEYGRLFVNDDRYLTVNRDSVFIMDIYEKVYTTDLIEHRDLIHLLKLDIARHRNVAAPLAIHETRIRKTIKGYETTQLIADLVGNKLFAPMKQLMFVTDQFPFPDSLLRSWYNATGFVDSDISIDYFALGDSLRDRGVISLLSKAHVDIPANKDRWLVTEIVALERVPVPPGFFRPPPDYKYYELRIPTEEDIWMARGMKMPGGPPEERGTKRQDRESMK